MHKHTGARCMVWSWPVLTRPLRLAVCVCVCLSVRYQMPTPIKHTHSVRNTEAFMDNFRCIHTHVHTHTKTHTHISFPLIQKRVSSGSCQGFSHGEQWASQKQPPRLSLCTQTITHAHTCTFTLCALVWGVRMRCFGQMLDQLFVSHRKSLQYCKNIRHWFWLDMPSYFSFWPVG